MGLMAQTTIYTNDMDYVIGDVKQAFIQDKISTGTQVDNLLAGFKAMKVNGIRIPIFPTGLEPNEQALNYFIQRATEEGFPIFANPAQGSGGQRIACESLAEEDRVAVKDDAEKRQILIDRIILIDKTYPDIKWINPFNEDAKTGTVWSVSDINTIYSTLANSNLNAELIGSCVWGIPAGIDILKNTDITDYITVSTTHNLGFNHSSWTEFISLSRAAGLPVWDSEVNHNKKYENKATRLEAALSYGVDGLVLYDSWSNISLTTGEVSSGGQTLMSLYLKPTSLDVIKDQTSNFDVYSHPSALSIDLFNASASHNIKLVNISGTQVWSASNVTSSEVYIDNLQKGVYILLVESNGITQSTKAVVL